MAMAVLGSVNGLCMLHDLSRTSTKKYASKLGRAQIGQNHRRGGYLHTDIRQRRLLQGAAY